MAPIQARKIRVRQPSHGEREQFRVVLNDAGDEQSLQAFLTVNPALLLRMLPPGGNILLYDRPKLGSEYIPDLLISVVNSQGASWTCIELESPTAKPLTGAGDMSAKLTHAIGQIDDWRDWLRDNLTYARGTLGLKGISNELNTWIVIGRRSTLNERQRRRYAALNRKGFTILSYDRLLDM